MEGVVLDLSFHELTVKMLWESCANSDYKLGINSL
jgi:hypothetical protein